MILYDTPGVIERKMHKLDTMMMRNVRSAAVNADCVLVVVDACKMPEKVSISALIVIVLVCNFKMHSLVQCMFLSKEVDFRSMKSWKKV